MKAIILSSFLLAINYSFSAVEINGLTSPYYINGNEHEEPKQVEISVTTNPLNGYLRININYIKLAGVVIYDEFECEVFSIVIDKKETYLNLSGLPTGTYTIEIQNDGIVQHEDIVLL